MKLRIVFLVMLATFLSACNTTPNRNSTLDQARDHFTAAQSDPDVTTLAPDELKRAAEMLNAAEVAWNSNENKATVDHLAYMANQRVTIAQETASSKAAQVVTSGAAAERAQTRLAMRTNEADTAKRRLVVSEASNAHKSDELALAAAAADAAATREAALGIQSDNRITDLEMQLKELNAVKTDHGMVVTLGDVLFDSGKSQLLPSGKRNMVKLADFFKRNPQVTATIGGYTDSVGAATYNRHLSQRRATSAMLELVSLGVERERLITQGYGESNPIASNDTPDGRKTNRRVEVVFNQKD